VTKSFAKTFESRYRARADFKRLNVEWLERHFHLEPIDEDLPPSKTGCTAASSCSIRTAHSGGRYPCTTASASGMGLGPRVRPS
jgi:hypothetical protein